MTFPIGAVAAAGIGAVTSIFQGKQQRDEADAANKTQKKQIKDQYKRDLKEWELNYLQAQSDYAFAIANTEAARYQERVRESDYEDQQERVIDAALLNLELNKEALQDQYVESERLRALEARLALDNDLNAQKLQYGETLTTLNFNAQESILAEEQSLTDIASNLISQAAAIKANSSARKAAIDNRAAQSTLASLDAASRYINSIKARGLEAQQFLAQKETEGRDIQEQIVIAEKLDAMQRDAEYISALVAGADSRASAVARSGGSNSSRRLALDSMQAFGRTYGLMKQQQADRRRRLNSYNSSLSGEGAYQLALIGNAIANEADRIKFTRSENIMNTVQFATERTAVDTEKTLDLAGLYANSQIGINNARDNNKLNLSRIAQQNQNAQLSYSQSTRALVNSFNELTLPSFDLAQRQYDRDLKALEANTQSTIDEASVPYREAIIIDPPEPIAGLKPEKGQFTPVAKPSFGSILSGAFVSGAQGALSMSYRDSSGNLAFY